MESHETIVALSSGAAPCAVAIIRVSGGECTTILSSSIGYVPSPRKAVLASINNNFSGELIDQGIVLWFPGPMSFTGEDCVEFQIHGGAATINSLINFLTRFRNVRMADPGEFSRRAFENGKLDLTEVEGLVDLINAQTEQQRKLALGQLGGSLGSKYSAWRQDMIKIQAMYAAEIDFVDEGDIPDAISNKTKTDINRLVQEMTGYLDDNRVGEIVREGFRIALMGKPNAGKSSLMNALVSREVAIVTDIPGTTRDVINAELDIDGFKVILSDTAGLRESDDKVERLGVERAITLADDVDLIVWLDSGGENPPTSLIKPDCDVLHMRSKDDDGEYPGGESISVHSGHGMDEFLNLLRAKLAKRVAGMESGGITRNRHRKLIEEAKDYLADINELPEESVDLSIEHLRLASNCLGKLTGKIDVEELLDVIFSEFCVGK